MSDGDWFHSVKNTFSKAGLLDAFLNEVPNPQTSFDQLFGREKDIFIQTALHIMQNKSKLRTLSFLKQTWKLEDYLLTVENTADRTALSKLRLSDHSLMIEKVRHMNINQSDRMCPFCPGHIDSFPTKVLNIH